MTYIRTYLPITGADLDSKKVCFFRARHCAPYICIPTKDGNEKSCVSAELNDKKTVNDKQGQDWEKKEKLKTLSKKECRKIEAKQSSPNETINELMKVNKEAKCCNESMYHPPWFCF